MDYYVNNFIVFLIKIRQFKLIYFTLIFNIYSKTNIYIINFYFIFRYKKFFIVIKINPKVNSLLLVYIYIKNLLLFKFYIMKNIENYI